MINKKELSENIEINHLHVDKEKIKVKEWFSFSDYDSSKFHLIEAFNETTNKEAYFLLHEFQGVKNMILYRYKDFNFGRRLKTEIIDGSEYLCIDTTKLKPCNYLIMYSAFVKKFGSNNIFII